MRPFSLSRRCVHTLTDDAHTREQLRALLRETAQSVAVVTARLPAHDRARHRHHPGPPTSTQPSSSQSPAAPASANTSASTSTTPVYHGATLSSFTSIALDPLPLVAFSLRIPSRMASALNAHVASSPSPSSAVPHLVVHILSAAQSHLADRFARPALYPRPFEDPRVPWSLSQEGLPVLSGVLGALSCALVGPSLPLARLCGSRTLDGGAFGEVQGEIHQGSGETRLASELFLARVLRVERVPALADDEQDGSELHRLPLLYHRRRYTTVGNDAIS